MTQEFDHIFGMSKDEMHQQIAERVQQLAAAMDLHDDLCDCESMGGRFGAHRNECPTMQARRADVVDKMQPDLGCPTEGCKGDVRYAAPGRGHREGCTHPMGDE